MKISSFKPSLEAQKMEVLHPVTNKKTGVYIHLLGMDSKEWRQCSKNIKERSLQSGKSKLSDEELEELPYELLSSVTVGWEGFEDDEGKPFEFTQDNAKELYRNAPTIVEQVDRFVGDRANFLPKS